MRTTEIEFLRVWRVEDTDAGFKFRDIDHAREKLNHWVHRYNKHRSTA